MTDFSPKSPSQPCNLSMKMPYDFLDMFYQLFGMKSLMAVLIFTFDLGLPYCV